MFCTRKSNYRLNRVHERALRIICISCINFLITEVLKYLNGLSSNLMNEVFRLKLNYNNFGNFNQLETYIPKTKSSLNSSVYRANQLWQLVPHEEI